MNVTKWVARSVSKIRGFGHIGDRQMEDIGGWWVKKYQRLADEGYWRSVIGGLEISDMNIILKTSILESLITLRGNPIRLGFCYYIHK